MKLIKEDELFNTMNDCELRAGTSFVYVVKNFGNHPAENKRKFEEMLLKVCKT